MRHIVLDFVTARLYQQGPNYEPEDYDNGSEAGRRLARNFGEKKLKADEDRKWHYRLTFLNTACNEKINLSVAQQDVIQMPVYRSRTRRTTRAINIGAVTANADAFDATRPEHTVTEGKPNQQRKKGKKAVASSSRQAKAAPSEEGRGTKGQLLTVPTEEALSHVGRRQATPLQEAPGDVAGEGKEKEETPGAAAGEGQKDGKGKVKEKEEAELIDWADDAEEAEGRNMA